MDAYGKLIESVKIQRTGEDHLYTIKYTCKDKYNDFYNKKLNNIFEKFLKDHAK